MQLKTKVRLARDSTPVDPAPHKPMNLERPTPDLALNAVLGELVTSAQAVLGNSFIHWAKHLEGSYFPRNVLKRYDPASQQLLYLDNTSRELVRSNHDNTQVVRWVVREHGITLAGPEPDELIDPVSADDLRQEVSATMHWWAQQMFADPDQMNNRWYQPFAVLSYCRMLYTLHTGGVASKPAGAQWARGALDRRWAGLIQRAWEERPNPSLKVRQKADPDDFLATLEFIRYALTQAPL